MLRGTAAEGPGPRALRSEFVCWALSIVVFITGLKRVFIVTMDLCCL